MRKVFCFAGCLFICFSSLSSATTFMIDFEDLNHGQSISGDELYHNVRWEYGNEGLYSNLGSWVCPIASIPEYDYWNIAQGSHNIANGGGCSEIGIDFQKEVLVLGADFSGQGYLYSWAKSIQVKGYLNDELVWATPSDGLKFTDPLTSDFIKNTIWLNMSSHSVDRIVICSTPNTSSLNPYGEYGWFGMDNLTYNDVPEPVTLALLALGSLAIRKRN